ncbi:MAG: hypothetical protein JXR64_04045 [Spirochaetales bacterium]|nr:hypothetical protein [Spirochaetales bacterium]
MKKVIFSILLILVITIRISSLEIKILSEKTIYKSKEPIIINVSIINNEENEIAVPVRFIPQDNYIRFIIVDPYGNRCEFKGYDTGTTVSDDDLIIMPPNSIITVPMDISSYYEMKRGAYGIKAYYYVSQNNKYGTPAWKGKLISNQVNIGIE